MNKSTLHHFALAAFATLTLAMTSCNGGGAGQSKEGAGQDSVAAVPVGDEAMNRALRFYAGMSKEGVDINENDAKAWEAYSATVTDFMQRSEPTLKMVDDIAANDFKDFRDSVDFVFYPFSGADFTYPFTLFPDADTYFLCGIEKTGMPIDKDIVTSFSQYETYRQALANYFRTSYFASKDMAADYNTMDVDGVCPVITMLMALNKCDIVSIKFKDIDAEGKIVSTADKRSLLEVKFCNTEKRREQTLYYFSSNVADNSFDTHLKAYLDATLPQHHVGSYMKAAAFMLHEDLFSTMRDYILKFSHAIVEDDSGIPYRFFDGKFDVTLYGEYKRPSEEFGERAYQADLEKLYLEGADKIKKLPCRIGYNSPSNWLVARRK